MSAVLFDVGKYKRLGVTPAFVHTLEHHLLSRVIIKQTPTQDIPQQKRLRRLLELARQGVTGVTRALSMVY
ncbi:MAG: hypothetical protein KTR32_11730 [Granulosicoccus sp.]|nr:hypothetical protein [Granulosicoccus sp.]